MNYLQHKQIKEWLLNGELDLSDVIDLVIELNGYIGVGIISLGEDMRTYCLNKLKEKNGSSNTEEK